MCILDMPNVDLKIEPDFSVFMYTVLCMCFPL